MSLRNISARMSAETSLGIPDLLKTSTTALSPVTESLRPGCARSVSMFTVRISESVNGAATEPNVVLVSIVIGNR